MSSKKRAKDRRRRKRRESRGPVYKSSKPGGSATPKVSDTISTPNEGIMTKRLDCKVAKVDESLGLVFGWAIICTENGQPYIDTQDDWIPDESMLKAATKFAKGNRQSGDMHLCEDGQIVHTMPLTAEVAKAFDIKCDKTGWMIAMAPDSPETLEKFRTGERTGFSIGGRRIKDTEVSL